jgi:hypothetical protein
MGNIIWPVFWILVVIGIVALPALAIYFATGGRIGVRPLRLAANIYAALLLLAAFGAFVAGAMEGARWTSYLLPAFAFLAAGRLLLYGLGTPAAQAELERQTMWLARITSPIGLTIIAGVVVIVLAVNSNREWLPVRIITVQAGNGPVAVVPSPNGGVFLAEEAFGPTYHQLQKSGNDEVLATPVNQRGLNPNLFGYELRAEGGIFQVRNIWWKPNFSGLFGPREYHGIYTLALDRHEKLVEYEEQKKELNDRLQALTTSGVVKRGTFDWDLALAIAFGALLIALLAFGAFRPAAGGGAFKALAFILFGLALATGGLHAYHTVWGAPSQPTAFVPPPPPSSAGGGVVAKGDAQGGSKAFAEGKAEMCANPKLAARYKQRLGCP